MSDMNCAACDELRATSSDYVQNGVTDSICASLQNNTGLNPSLSHDDAEDMHNINDCTIGKMAAELEAYDVCDWKEFMAKFLPNLYEFNKAVNCVDAGQWASIDSLQDRSDLLCQSIDTVLAIVRGSAPKAHPGTWLQSFLDKLKITITPDETEEVKTIYHPSFDADILEGAGCTASKRLGRYQLNTYWDTDIYPKGRRLDLISPISAGEVIGTIPRSAVPASDYSDSRWEQICRSGTVWQWYFINGDTAWYVQTRGYVMVSEVFEALAKRCFCLCGE